MAGSLPLFEHALPPGFHYRHDFITEADERDLLAAIADVAFSDFAMRGMKFRPYRSPASPAPTSSRRAATSELMLARRSAYLMTEESRTADEHHIPPSPSCAIR